MWKTTRQIYLCRRWGLPRQLDAWATQFRNNIAAVVGRWRHCVRFDGPGNQT